MESPTEIDVGNESLVESLVESRMVEYELVGMVESRMVEYESRMALVESLVEYESRMVESRMDQWMVEYESRKSQYQSLVDQFEWKYARMVESLHDRTPRKSQYQSLVDQFESQYARMVESLHDRIDVGNDQFESTDHKPVQEHHQTTLPFGGLPSSGLFHDGSSRPILKKLQKAGVIAAASSRWYQLGIELLDDDQLTHLRIIKEINDDVAACCSAMLGYWIQTHPNATWYQLVAAMKAPGVELNELAAIVEKSFTEIGFPCTLKDLDKAGARVEGYRGKLDADHPGFKDDFNHKIRREIAKNYKQSTVHKKLTKLHATHACKEYNDYFTPLEEYCGFRKDNIPQLEDVSNYFKKCSGFRVKPIAGLFTAQDFLALEVPLLADPTFASFSEYCLTDKLLFEPEKKEKLKIQQLEASLQKRDEEIVELRRKNLQLKKKMKRVEASSKYLKYFEGIQEKFSEICEQQQSNQDWKQRCQELEEQLKLQSEAQTDLEERYAQSIKHNERLMNSVNLCRKVLDRKKLTTSVQQDP